MTYRIPDSLVDLRAWLRSNSAQDSFATERQAAFMAQQLAGTRFRFPPKGASCFTVLQQIEAALPKKAVTGDFASERRKGKKRGKANLRIPRSGDCAPIIREVPAGLVIYADGACEPNPGAGGWGFVVYRDGVEIHADCGGDLEATNQTMELTAATRALEWFAVRGVVEPVRLFSDSRYTVEGCNSWRHNWKAKGWRRGKPNGKGPEGEVANLELWQALDQALTAVPITLEWCKGHAGIVGNERADELSVLGREKTLEAADPLTAEYRSIMAGVAA